MEQTTPFSEALDAVDQLSPVDQEILVEIIHHRIAERGRARLADEAKEAREEFDRGRCHTVTADELIDEIRS